MSTLNLNQTSFFKPLLSKQVLDSIPILKDSIYGRGEPYARRPCTINDAVMTIESNLQLLSKPETRDDLAIALAEDVSKIPATAEVDDIGCYPKYLPTPALDSFTKPLRTLMNLFVTLSTLDAIISQGKYNKGQRLDSFKERIYTALTNSTEIIQDVFAKVKALQEDGYGHFMRIARAMTSRWIEPNSSLGKSIGLNEGL